MYTRANEERVGGGVPPPPFEKFNHLNLHSKIPLKKDFDPSPPPPKKKPQKIIPLKTISLDPCMLAKT